METCNSFKIIYLNRFSADKGTMTTVDGIMSGEVVSIDMDTSIRNAVEVCEDKRIRHLPVVDDQKQLAGLVTDRDLRHFMSPRIGTLSENNADRENLKRPVHLIMVRNVVTASPGKSLAEAAELMLKHRVGCLPIVDADQHVVGILTKSDLIRHIAQG